MLTDLRELGVNHLREMIGVFGWLNFPLPWFLVLGFLLLLALGVCLLEPGTLRLSWPMRALFFATALAGFVAAEFAIYSMWNAVGAPRVQGFQGRYFLPLLPFLLISLANDWLRRVPRMLEALLAGALLLDLLALGWLAHATFS